MSAKTCLAPAGQGSGLNETIGSDTYSPADSMGCGGEDWSTAPEPEFTQMFFADLVVIARGPEPDPIPNSTVKPLCANGTKSQGLGE